MRADIPPALLPFLDGVAEIVAVQLEREIQRAEPVKPTEPEAAEEDAPA